MIAYVVVILVFSFFFGFYFSKTYSYCSYLHAITTLLTTFNFINIDRALNIQ